MLKRLIAPALGLALVAAGAATPARADDGRIIGALAGIATLAIIGSAIANAQKDRDRGPEVVTITPPPPVVQPPVVQPPAVPPPVVHRPVKKQPRPKQRRVRPLPPRYAPYGWHHGWTYKDRDHRHPGWGHDRRRWDNDRGRRHDGRKDGRKHAAH